MTLKRIMNLSHIWWCHCYLEIFASFLLYSNEINLIKEIIQIGTLTYSLNNLIFWIEFTLFCLEIFMYFRCCDSDSYSGPRNSKMIFSIWIKNLHLNFIKSSCHHLTASNFKKFEEKRRDAYFIRNFNPRFVSALHLIKCNRYVKTNHWVHINC